MFSLIQSASVCGVEGNHISVEVDISSGLPRINIVGLPDPAVRESVDRVRSALKNSGFAFPMDRITVNLAPADLRKEGTAFDLAIAAGILTASGQMSGELFVDTLLIGELSLNGGLRPVNGVLAMIEQAKQRGIGKVLLPEANSAEAAWISGITLYAITHLKQLTECAAESLSLEHLQVDGRSLAQLRACTDSERQPPQEKEDFADIIGQHHAKRAMLIAAAGKHNILLSGPPGTGKTMMIRRLPGILPMLTEEEALEVTKIYSVAGKLPRSAQGLLKQPPFRAPHHNISNGGLIGGGTIPKPGEITLAHRGVLFLDELPEFPRSVLELLRQPLEDRMITIARARATIHFPASIMLAASFNPCPCGYYGHEFGEKRCVCSSSIIARYRSKLSGPLIDRIDLQLEVPRPSSFDRQQSEPTVTSSKLRDSVEAARERQLFRNRKFGVHVNSELSGATLRKATALKSDARKLLDDAFELLGISMRAFDRLLKLSRTIADVEGSDSVDAEHIAEAIQYRRLDMQLK
ncbi:YifB family Mg chelatase-like AAA ATPase [Paenibacillus sp. HB172176]|uniref:YifB family Mg chelatase-like AAA ATPase n=1 Tax=Paenibacillus sp. HB172176 TaxID=2493690 RepID=UPI00143A098F|nr:YifB family Mg chelatase-like AAA ATPase [Paenibacillus sp. HB172176]